MIRLTDQNDKAVYISVDSVVAVYDGGMATSIDVGEDEVYSVKESPEEIARKVLLHNLAKSDYASGNENVKETAQLALMYLSGLETGGTTE